MWRLQSRDTNHMATHGLSPFTTQPASRSGRQSATTVRGSTVAEWFGASSVSRSRFWWLPFLSWFVSHWLIPLVLCLGGKGGGICVSMFLDNILCFWQHFCAGCTTISPMFDGCIGIMILRFIESRLFAHIFDTCCWVWGVKLLFEE